MKDEAYRHRYDEELARITRDAFRLITGAASAILAALVPLHATLAPAPWKPVVTIAGTLLTLIFVGTFIVDLRRPLRPATTMRLLPMIAITLTISNLIVLLAWRRPEATGFELLLLLTVAYFMLSARLFALIVILIVATFELAVGLIGDPADWMLARAMLWMAIFLAYVIRIGRFRNITKLLDTQLALSERTHQLQRLLRQTQTLPSATSGRSPVPDVDEETIRNLETVVRLREELLRRLSRDLSTPLTAILGFADLIAQRAGRPEMRRFATWIRRAAHRLVGGVSTALDLTQLEAGELTPQLAPCDLKALIARVVEHWGVLAEDRGLEFRTFLEPVAVMADAARLERILDQLVEDAIRATARGWVALSASADDEKLVTVEIRDTGDRSRMSPPEMNEQQVTLQILQRLVQAMGGAMEWSESGDQGRSIRIELPSASIQAALPDAAGSHDDESRILVVDDDAHCLRLIGEVLGDQVGIDLAETPEQALDYLLSKRYGLVLLDINLKHPEIDGIELLRRIRDLPGGHAVRVFALTAYALEQDRRNFLDIGFNGYIAKPFSPATLLETISRFLPGA